MDGGQTEKNPSAWTIDSLHAHILGIFDERELRYTQRFVAQEKAVVEALAAAKEAVAAALTAADRAVQKAETAAEKRFDNVNEFRGQLNDQAKTFMPRQEFQVQHDALESKVGVFVDSLSDKIDSLSRHVTESVASLQLSRATDRGQQTARKEDWTKNVAVIGVVFGLVGAISVIVSLLAR